MNYMTAMLIIVCCIFLNASFLIDGVNNLVDYFTIGVIGFLFGLAAALTLNRVVNT